ncbi:MAG: SH3 domain-containing protein [Rhodosalinus sp.]
MWGFIIATFVFLALVFYQASGGADYQPSASSLQAQERAVPAAPAEPARTAATADAPAAGTQATAGVTLAAARAQPEAPRDFDRDTPEPDDGGLFSSVVMPSGATREPQAPAMEPQAPATTPPVVSASAANLRAVGGNRVNMRAGPGTGYGVLTTLSRGDRVIVLDDPGQGWVKLRVQEGGRVGWMAASLLDQAD